MYRLISTGLGVTTLIVMVGAGCRARLDKTPRESQSSATASRSSRAEHAEADQPRRYTYTSRPYPLDERGFSPVDRALAEAFACNEMISDDGSLNPYVLKVISAYPLDGSYPYHCSWDPREYDIYNGVTQEYEGFWVDNASTIMQFETGTVDESGRIWTMTSEMADPGGGRMARRSVITLEDEDHHSMESFFIREGKEFKGMEIRYTRSS